MAKKNNSSYTFAIILTLFVFAAIAAFVIISNNNKEKSNDTEFAKLPPIEDQPTLGSSDAPVKVVEFGDFKCPACKAWGETIFPQLIADYVDNGDVEFGYINVLFHGEESTLGSAAAEAVLQLESESYWDFHKLLFDGQPSSNDHDNVWLTMDKVNEVAEATTDIDLADLQAAMQDQKTVDAVNADNELVKEFKVQMTPSIMVNGTMLEDPFDYERIKELIEQELEGNK